MALRIVYIFFLGILLAAFIGFGIAAFYPGPESPDYTRYYKTIPPDGESTEAARLLEDQKALEIEQKEYNEKNNVYSRNVSLIAIGLSIAVLAISIIFSSKTLILADGLLLGGLLTLGYGIIRGLSTQDNMFRFVTVAVGLAVALILGYLKFTKTSSQKRGK